MIQQNMLTGFSNFSELPVMRERQRTLPPCPRPRGWVAPAHAGAREVRRRGDVGMGCDCALPARLCDCATVPACPCPTVPAYPCPTVPDVRLCPTVPDADVMPDCDCE